MVKLTPDLINNCIQRINPIRDRELNLRGCFSDTLQFVYFLKFSKIEDYCYKLII